MNPFGNRLLAPCFRPRQRRFVGAFRVVWGVFALTILCVAGVCGSVRADSWALLIGIDQYPQESGINRLTGADNDANALSKTLRDVLKVPADHIKTLTSTGSVKPTRQAILRELNALKSHVQPGDTVFVAYSGHGIESDGTPYLLPYDADITNTELIRDTGLPESKFMEYLKTIPAKALILVFDMCRESVDKTKGVTPNTLTGVQVKGVQLSSAPASEGGSASVLKRPEVVATFFACSPDGSSYEMPGQSRGYFSFYLEQGLRGYAADKEGKVSLAGLQAYLAKTVPQAVQKDKPGGEAQVPTSTIIGPLDGGGFVVVTVNVSTLTGIATASAKMQQALALVPELIQSASFSAKVAPDNWRSRALMAVWQAQFKAGDTEGAKQTLVIAKRTNETESGAYSLGDLAAAQAEVGDIAGAKQTVSTVEIVEYKISALRAVAEAQVKAGDASGATKTLMGAKQAAGTMRDVALKASVLCAIANAQVKAGDTEGAKQTFVMVKQALSTAKQGTNTEGLCEIATTQTEMGDMGGAKQTLAMAKLTLKHMETKERGRMLLLIAESQNAAGDSAGAKQTLVEAKQAIYAIKDADDKSFLLGSLAVSQAGVGDIVGAKQTAKSIESVGDAVFVNTNKRKRASALLSIANRQIEAGDTKGAKQTIMEAQKTIEGGLYGEEQLLFAETVLSMVAAQFASGDAAEAKQTLAELKRLAEDMSGDNKSSTLSNIAQEQIQEQIKEGDFMGAKVTIEELTDAGKKATALANLASAILDAAKKESDDAQKQAAPASAAIAPPAAKTP